MRYERVTLPNGVRVLVTDMPDARSASIAVYVGVGSRAETKVNAGTSHFLEHMVFKGTANRPSASEISQQIEGVGGSVNASTDKAATAVTARFGDLPVRAPLKWRAAPRAGRRRTRTLGKRGEQAHVCIGWRGVPQLHPDKFTLDLLSAVLGEGMSSRLFLELREKRALAYDAHSYISNYSDAGHVVIYAGVAPTRAKEAVSAALAEVARLRETPVPEAELLRVRDFLKGRIELRLEHSRGGSSWLAGQELSLGRIRSVEELGWIIDGISAADIQRVAQRYLRPELAYLAAVGPRATVTELGAPVADEEPTMEKAS